MPLNSYQFALSLDTVYELKRFDDLYEYLNPSIFMLGGSVDVYTSESATPPTGSGDMQLEHTDQSGHKALSVIPRYILLTENTATVSEVVLTGVKPTAI